MARLISSRPPAAQAFYYLLFIERSHQEEVQALELLVSCYARCLQSPPANKLMQVHHLTQDLKHTQAGKSCITLVQAQPVA